MAEVPEVENYKLACISTLHLTPDTAQALEWQEFGFIVADYPEGAFVSCQGLSAGDPNPCGEDWPDLHAVRLWAAERGFRYVMLDRDADPVDGLPKYDW